MLGILLISLLVFVLSGCTETGQLTMNWKADLTTVKQDMVQKEISLRNNPELAKAFSESIDRIIKRLRTYKNDDQVKVALSKAIASIGQLHTSLELGDELKLPFRLYLYKEKLYVIDTLPAYSNSLFTELTKINHQDVAPMIKELREVVSVDNEHGFGVRIPENIIKSSILHGLGVIKDQGEILLTFEREDASDLELSVKWIDSSMYTNPISPHKDKLLYLKYRDSNYTHTYLPESKVLYAIYNTCTVDPGYSVEQYTKDIMNTLKQATVEKLIIDLRNNGGGDSEVIRPFLNKLAELPEINDHIVVLMGRNTASSAMIYAIQLQSQFKAVLIGEPVNGDPNKAGQVRTLSLPETGLIVNYSTKEFHMLSSEIHELAPDILITPTIAELRAGADPVLKAALKYKFNPN